MKNDTGFHLYLESEICLIKQGFVNCKALNEESAKWRALRAHVPKYILQTRKLRNGNFVPIRFQGYWFSSGP